SPTGVISPSTLASSTISTGPRLLSPGQLSPGRSVVAARAPGAPVSLLTRPVVDRPAPAGARRGCSPQAHNVRRDTGAPGGRGASKGLGQAAVRWAAGVSGWAVWERSLPWLGAGSARPRRGRRRRRGGRRRRESVRFA